MIGTVGAVRLPQEFEDAVEIAYGVHSDFWGNGYASEGLGMFVELYWTAGRKLSSLCWCSHIEEFNANYSDRKRSECDEKFGGED
jgi:hypothetical protein